MTQLSDTQSLILSAAAQRPEHIALPLPESLRGGAAAKVVGAMLSKGLLQEVDADLRKGDTRNPVVGTRLIREWDGMEHTVTVMKDGFDLQGRKFKSLSAAARAITGTQWNGYRFFGLREARRDDR